MTDLDSQVQYTKKSAILHGNSGLTIQGATMGIYFNTGTEKFASALRSKIYIDKTDFLAYTNSVIDTENRYVCVSRPRRFGKSVTAAMLSAYYGKGCDAGPLFADRKIAQSADYKNYLNRYDVIEADMNVFRQRMHAQNGYTISACEAVRLFQREVIAEIVEAYPDCFEISETDLPNVMAKVHAKTGAKFIVILDEWDVFFRENTQDEAAQTMYLNLLRGIFKNATSKEFLALGYLTGILPVKKYGTQSALNNFDEFTMINPEPLEQFVGFTEEEVQKLCREYRMDFDEIRQWYDGYQLGSQFHIYNPKSVSDAMRRHKIANYWTRTETYESLKKYISMNYEGLKDAIIQMLGGECCHANPDKFQNDMVTFESRDDIFALLIHLGYLSYDYSRREVSIPNEEIRSEFRNAVEGNRWKTVVEAIEDSEKLLRATWKQEEENVAKAVAKVHRENISLLKYNDENSLSCVITLAYYSAMDEYIRIRELPAGEGFADIVFLPRKNSEHPAMVIELKYNKTAESAIDQIKKKQYTSALENYCGQVLLVGISYHKKTKEHTCRIEKIEILQETNLQ